MRCSSLRQNSMRCRCLTPLFTWVAVVGRGDEAQWGAVLYRQRLAVEVVGEEYVGAEQVFERQAGAGAVLGAQHDEARRSGVRRAERHDDLLVEVGKAHAAPAQAAAGPGGDAVKVRGLLDARELRERVACIGADVGRWGGCGGGAAVGKADVQVDALGLAGEARCKRGEAEAREVRAFALAGGGGGWACLRGASAPGLARYFA